MILCEPKIHKFIRRDPYERSLAELRLFPDRNPAAMHSIGYARLGNAFVVSSNNHWSLNSFFSRTTGPDWCWSVEICQ